MLSSKTSEEGDDGNAAKGEVAIIFLNFVGNKPLKVVVVMNGFEIGTNGRMNELETKLVRENKINNRAKIKYFPTWEKTMIYYLILILIIFKEVGIPLASPLGSLIKKSKRSEKSRFGRIKLYESGLKRREL